MHKTPAEPQYISINQSETYSGTNCWEGRPTTKFPLCWPALLRARRSGDEGPGVSWKRGTDSTSNHHSPLHDSTDHRTHGDDETPKARFRVEAAIAVVPIHVDWHHSLYYQCHSTNPRQPIPKDQQILRYSAWMMTCHRFPLTNPSRPCPRSKMMMTTTTTRVPWPAQLVPRILAHQWNYSRRIQSMVQATLVDEPKELS